ncbi:uncharacterized protein EAE98_007784 [Botrytis deweyae]|uniref:ribonuclease H n=1 Tax=Botrytis deweyae TaxID=2478750 RepID=A0ABQ7IG08_9HELO|nr:uncharacterized protein EAE98_007784 [Botrytis deweyae]KAF7923079.1 hypothetical protein EAE98_007784 [Botrytis deweyae]
MPEGNEGSAASGPPEYQVFDPRSAFTLLSAPGTEEPTGSLERNLALDPMPIIRRFYPPLPTDTPNMLFNPAHRFIRRTNPHEILIYTDGSCLSNGLEGSRAGCGFVISPHHKLGFRLENLGPTGESHPQTSNRAELRAVVAALEYRVWQGDSYGAWTRLIIATDSEYVVLGATERINRWIQRGWRTSTGSAIMNQDLWERLIYYIKKAARPIGFSGPPHGTSVAFWKIPREWNGEADAEARKGAQLEGRQEFQVMSGMMV